MPMKSATENKDIEPKTILILEDEMIIAKSIKSYIEKIGYKVAGIAQNGQDAISIAKEKKPSLAILDIVIDGDMDGIETAKEFIKLNIPFLYLTAYGDAKTRQRANENYPLGYIIKPFNDKVISNTIKEAFEKINQNYSK